MTKPSLENLGVTTQWLMQGGKPALQAYYRRYVGPDVLSPKQEAFFLTSFADPANATEWMNSANNGQFMRTDDYPNAGVTITYANGTNVRLSSESQSVYMTPWKIGDGKSETFNADISRAIATLIPPDAPTYDRLSGATLAGEYTDWLLLGHIRERLETIGAKEKLTSQLQPLEEQFTISSMSLGSIVSDDLDGSESLQLHLRNRQLPQNASIYMTLWAPGCKIENVPGAIAASDRYTALALSVPWLRNLLSNHPEYSAEIRVVQDRSISQQLTESVIADLKAHGKATLAAEVQKNLPQMTFLYVNGQNGSYARWFVFPDRRMLLWNYKFGTALQDQLNGLPTWDWYGHTGVAALFSPDGRILPGESQAATGPSPAPEEMPIHFPMPVSCG